VGLLLHLLHGVLVAGAGNAAGRELALCVLACLLVFVCGMELMELGIGELDGVGWRADRAQGVCMPWDGAAGHGAVVAEAVSGVPELGSGRMGGYGLCGVWV